jgi:hypothetical protein
VPLHVAVVFARTSQVVHDAPQASTVLLATQVVPRKQNPGVSQTMRQPKLPPLLSHTAIPLAGGVGHAVHAVPQEARLRLDTHVPAAPAGQ